MTDILFCGLAALGMVAVFIAPFVAIWIVFDNINDNNPIKKSIIKFLEEIS